MALRAAAMCLLIVTIAATNGTDVGQEYCGEQEVLDFVKKQLRRTRDLDELLNATQVIMQSEWISFVEPVTKQRLLTMVNELKLVMYLTSDSMGISNVILQSVPLFEMLMNQNQFSWNEFFGILAQRVSFENYNFAFEVIAFSQPSITAKQSFNHNVFSTSVFNLLCAMFEKFDPVSISQQELIQFLRSMIKLCDVFGIRIDGCVWDRFFGRFTFELTSIHAMMSIINAHKCGVRYGIPPPIYPFIRE